MPRCGTVVGRPEGRHHKIMDARKQLAWMGIRQ